MRAEQYQLSGDVQMRERGRERERERELNPKLCVGGKMLMNNKIASCYWLISAASKKPTNISVRTLL